MAMTRVARDGDLWHAAAKLLLSNVAPRLRELRAAEWHVAAALVHSTDALLRRGGLIWFMNLGDLVRGSRRFVS